MPKILIVDDEPGIRFGVRDFLESEGLEVDEAGSVAAYPATKLAVPRWVRRHAPGAEWIGAGVTLNARA